MGEVLGLHSAATGGVRIHTWDVGSVPRSPALLNLAWDNSNRKGKE